MKFFNAILSAAAILFSSHLPAQVHRSPNGVGGALILPYWTTSVGNDSLISIRNDSERASAIKLLWLDEQGGLVLSANLYLDARSIWTGAATDELNPRMVHLVQPNACLLPLTLNDESEFGPELRVFPLGAPRGSMEIIEMGSIAVDSPLAPEGKWIDCDALAERWSDGPWAADATACLLPPAGRLSANNNLINVALGGMNTIEATALGGFSDIVQHTAPQDSMPDLSHAFDSGSDGGGVRSLVCTDGDCRIDEWTLPVEAVAAVLTTSVLLTDYNIVSGLVAEFEWVVHRPLDRYQALIPEPGVESAPFISFFTRGGEQYVFCPPEQGCIDFGDPNQPEFGTSEFDFELEGSIEVLALARDVESVDASPLLGHPIDEFAGIPPFSPTEREALHQGMLRLRFDQQETSLTASDGSRYLGEPVIAFGIQQFTNGAIPGGVLANYRGTEAPRYELTILEPE
jgi:hypothetical protein